MSRGGPIRRSTIFEEYRKRTPDDTKVIDEIKRIQSILANDLLVIVENEGAWTLWRDLAKVIPRPAGRILFNCRAARIA